MKKGLLSLLIIMGLSIITCGNEAPEPFYNGTPEDSTAIMDSLDNHPELLLTDDQFIAEYVALKLKPVRFFIADSYFRNDSTIIKQLADSCGVQHTRTDRFMDLWFTKDTTCTVYLWDTFTVISLMHYDKRYTGYYFWQGDTDKALDTVTVDTTKGYDSVENVTGVGLRHIFFDVVREPVVDEETGDTVMVVKQPFEWVMKRISYGTYNFPEAGSEVPIIYYIVLDPDKGGPRSDTVWSYLSPNSYDTTYTGHLMNRFRALDSLLEYDADDTLSVSIAVVQVDDTLCSFFASCGNSNKVRLEGGNGKLPLTGAGIKNLYLTCVVNDSYYYVKPRKTYNASVWLIPVRIGGVQ